MEESIDEDRTGHSKLRALHKGIYEHTSETGVNEDRTEPKRAMTEQTKQDRANEYQGPKCVDRAEEQTREGKHGRRGRTKSTKAKTRYMRNLREH